jgi:von Hippel-Lindau disease tumor supressor
MQYIGTMLLSVSLLNANVSLAASPKCKGESQLRSIDSVEKATVIFRNRSNATRLIYWIDFSGARILYQKIKPNRSYTQQTYLTHPWIATTETGKCIGVYLPNPYVMEFGLK